jgi:hypothetical protein
MNQPEQEHHDHHSSAASIEAKIQLSVDSVAVAGVVSF